MLPPSSQFRNIKFIRNQSNAAKTANFGSRYQQDIEPAGSYFITDELGTGNLPSGWVRGTKHFNNPLVIEWNTNPNGGYDATSWKAQLQKMFKAKGKKLSQRLLQEGYDAIITVQWQGGRWETSECVDLTVIR